MNLFDWISILDSAYLVLMDAGPLGFADGCFCLHRSVTWCTGEMEELAYVLTISQYHVWNQEILFLVKKTHVQDKLMSLRHASSSG